MDSEDYNIPWFDVRAMISIGDDPQIVEIHLDDIETDSDEEEEDSDTSSPGSSIFQTDQLNKKEAERPSVSEGQSLDATLLNETTKPQPKTEIPHADIVPKGETSPPAKPLTKSEVLPRVIPTEKTPGKQTPTPALEPTAQKAAQRKKTARQKFKRFCKRVGTFRDTRLNKLFHFRGK